MCARTLFNDKSYFQIFQVNNLWTIIFCNLLPKSTIYACIFITYPSYCIQKRI